MLTPNEYLFVLAGSVTLAAIALFTKRILSGRW
jgi:hypothetical protein